MSGTQCTLPVYLSELMPDESGCISQCFAQGALKQKLISMGFVPGAQLQMIRNAPLRDPIEIAIQNSLVTLRRSEAGLIMVKKV